MAVFQRFSTGRRIAGMKKAHRPKKGSRRAAKPWWLWAVLLAFGMQIPIEVGKGLVVDVTKEKAREALNAIHFPVDWDRMTSDQVLKRLTAPTWEELVAKVRVERMEAERKSFEKELPRRWLPSFSQ